MADDLGKWYFYPKVTTLSLGLCIHKFVCRLSVTFVHPSQRSGG